MLEDIFRSLSNLPKQQLEEKNLQVSERSSKRDCCYCSKETSSSFLVKSLPSNYDHCWLKRRRQKASNRQTFVWIGDDTVSTSFLQSTAAAGFQKHHSWKLTTSFSHQVIPTDVLSISEEGSLLCFTFHFQACFIQIKGSNGEMIAHRGTFEMFGCRIEWIRPLPASNRHLTSAWSYYIYKFIQRTWLQIWTGLVQGFVSIIPLRYTNPVPESTFSLY